MTRFLRPFLVLIARAYLRKYKPTIVGITGNVGKTSTRDAIAAVLSETFQVKTGVGSINNLFGIPLTIIGSDKELKEYITGDGGTFGFWLKLAIAGLWRLLIKSIYPQILVLEYGADRPGDIKQLVSLFPPHIAVVTGVGQVPVHVEFFASPQVLADEKANILKRLNQSDYAVLNFDDLTVLEMKEKTRAQVWTFGFGGGANMEIVDFRMLEEPMPVGIVFNLKNNGQTVPVELTGTLGKPQALSCAAAVSVAGIFGVSLINAAEGLNRYKPPAGRMRILKGIKGSTIIDDTYNSSPIAVHVALDTLRQAYSSKRKVAVLGDMLELGKYSIDVHRDIGNRVGNIVDFLVCVGEKAKFIADSAGNQLSKDRIFTFSTSDEAKTKVQEIIQAGDLVLVKGSQGKRMEKIVEEIMAEPERKTELLVRQSKRWLLK